MPAALCRRARRVVLTRNRCESTTPLSFPPSQAGQLIGKPAGVVVHDRYCSPAGSCPPCNFSPASPAHRGDDNLPPNLTRPGPLLWDNVRRQGNGIGEEPATWPIRLIS